MGAVDCSVFIEWELLLLKSKWGELRGRERSTEKD